jgi:peptidoglycan/LPS O-acetylase OafA/YrhL
LDGLRAVSVVAVIAYHAHALGAGGFGAARGGFLGVELFFVVSGYLITSLLLDEWARFGGISLAQFWVRRARRLLPALATLLVVVLVLAATWRTDTLARLRTDLPAAVFYVSNWAQVFAKVGYFDAVGAPPLLRHLWSLAVEEQWYLLWPPVFIALMRAFGGNARRIRLPILAGAVASVVTMQVLYRSGDADRTNLVYLATFTRAGGLLIGAALATAWTPWRWPNAGRRHLVGLDAIGIVSIAGLTAAVVGLSNTSSFVYRGGLTLVSLLSAVAIATVVHPGARWMQAAFTQRWLVAVGKRSYGLYLWHWPAFVLARVDRGIGRLVLALAASVAASELCYRYVEQPVRHGVLGRWWARLRAGGRWQVRAGLYATVPVLVLAPFLARVATADDVNLAVDRSADVAFEPAVDTATTVAAEVAAAPTTTIPAARRIVLVGDSQAHSLAVNLPAGIERTFAISNGAVEGCGLMDTGRIVSVRPDFTKNLAECQGWQVKWANAARANRAEIALVVIGAWDLFDVAVPRGQLVYGSADLDNELQTRLKAGIDALIAAGAQVALLEVACMRPIESPQSPVPLLPERGDDARVTHLNGLLRAAAAADPTHVTFVPGPTAWCNDPAVASDLSYRWDGVHVYKPGAKLVFDTIAPALSAIPLDRR